MTRGLLARRLPYPALTIVGFWIFASIGLSELTKRVTDWYVMTDELVYERLAISIAHAGSPLPRVHGAFVRSLDQLYPAIIAPLFQSGSVLTDLHRAHILGAWVMTSACIPVFFLGRRVTGRLWPAYLIATLSICIPWMLYASFLLSEVVAYPAFLWAMLAIQAATSTPSRRNDLFALAALVIAFLARTELVALAAVFPLTVVAFELGRTRAAGVPRRIWAGVRSSVQLHPAAALAYGLLVVATIAYLASGRTLANLTTYGSQTNLSLIPHGIGREFLGHIAQVAFATALLPFVVGMGWAYSSIRGSGTHGERHAFACLTAVVVPVLTYVVAKWDTSIGLGSVTYDRYLFYLVPPILLAFVCALLEERRPRWSAVAVAAVVSVGFVVQLQSSFTWSPNLVGPVDADSPVSIFYRPIVHAVGTPGATRAALVGATFLLTAAFAAAARIRNPAYLTAVCVVFIAVVFPLASYRVFQQVLTHNGTASRPLTGAGNGTSQLGWVDQVDGTSRGVTIVPYRVSSDFYVTLRYWRDLEFWNKSVVRNAEYPSTDEYAFTGNWFPKIGLGIDPATGAVAESPTRDVIQAVTESRFRIAGRIVVQTPEVLLIRARRPWRLAWLTMGAYDDGWMRPGIPTTIRVYPTPGQRTAAVRVLSLQVHVPGSTPSRAFHVVSNLERFDETATPAMTTFLNAVHVCVPHSGYATVVVRADGASEIPGDLAAQATLAAPRLGSIDLADISVSDYTVGPCRPHR